VTAFGTGPWGTGAYGVAAELSIDHAFAISTRQVVVVLTKPPQDISPFLVGDVRAIGSWLITNLDTGGVLIISKIEPYNQPLQWAITTLTQFPFSTTQMQVTAVGLRDAGGAVVQAPRTANFAGVTERALSTPTQVAASRRIVNRDLANLPASSGEQNQVGGTLQIQGGDYALTDGPDLVKKLIIRRLTTTPGDFFHIPNYGVGLRVKEPIPGGDLVKLKASITLQLLREPDVAQADVTLEQTTNLLIVKVKAKLASTGQVVNVGVNTQIGQR